MKSFDGRRRDQLAVTVHPPRIITLAELMTQPREPSSEERLAHAPAGTWSAKSFRDATRRFQEAACLRSRLCSGTDYPPDLTADVEYKYGDVYRDSKERMIAGERLLVAVVLEEPRVIGFAIAAQGPNNETVVEIIDVDRSSRRLSGLRLSLRVNEWAFTVGVAHLLVDLLASHIEGVVKVDATNPPSRYVFKSLGFVSRPGEVNPCLLWRPPIRG